MSVKLARQHASFAGAVLAPIGQSLLVLLFHQARQVSCMRKSQRLSCSQLTFECAKATFYNIADVDSSA